MRVVKLQEFIRLPCGHAYQYLGSHDSNGAYIRDTQYKEDENGTILTLSPVKDAAAPVNDWVRTSFGGLAAHTNGCLQNDFKTDTMDEILRPMTQRDAMYRDDEAEFLVYTDADMFLSIAIQIAGLRRLMGFASLGNSNDWEIRWEAFFKHITYEIATNNAEYSDDQDGRESHQWRRIAYWALQQGPAMPTSTMTAIAARLGFSVHHLERNPPFNPLASLCDALSEVIATYDIPEIPRDYNELRTLYRKETTE